MRKNLPEKFEDGRVINHDWSEPAGSMGGAFIVMGPCGAELRIVASRGDHPSAMGWEHVSVSTERRCPNWQEMQFVKEAFWEDEETAFQLHPRRSQYVTNHPNVLHMWRHVERDPPLPPSILVGIKEDGEYADRYEAARGMQRAIDKGLID
jgi:hypothetical protein